MRMLTKATLAALAALALAGPAAAQFGGPPPPPNTGVPLYTTLTGGEGAGHITVVVDPPKGTACYIINVSGLDNVTAAHIHKGGPGERRAPIVTIHDAASHALSFIGSAFGAPVVPLEAPADGTSGGCAPVTAEVSAALLDNPGGYYVNVHTRAFPNGAIRGQLSK